MKEEGAERFELVDTAGNRGTACVGKVLAVGPGKPLPDGRFLKPQVKKGNIVYFGHTTGVDMNLGGAKVVVMRSEDILGVKCD